MALTIFPSRHGAGENGIANALNQAEPVWWNAGVRHGKMRDV
jgi:hypothetical protein